MEFYRRQISDNSPRYIVKYRIRPIGVALAVCALSLMSANISTAQNAFNFSGLLYSDYSYTLQSPDADRKGENGFGYRRVYFTANYTQSDRFSGRLRLEASDGSTTNDGKPAPFVKDLYLKWKGALGDGHDVVMGVSGPPSFTVAEKVWGYRSLEKTIQDKDEVVSSRDMGVALSGNLVQSGTVRYGVMIANNEGIKAESDKHKRVYGQLELYPASGISLTLGGDYASFENGSAYNLNGFAGLTTHAVRLGIEGFVTPRSYDGSDEKMTRLGVSVFAIAKASETTSAIIRVDRYEEEFMGQKDHSTFLLAGLGFRVDSGVEIIPNILVDKDKGADDAEIAGRLTLSVTIK